MTEAYASLHVFVSGDVQGVGFRYFVMNRALELNLYGWVRNLYEGGVEVLAEGPRIQLEHLLADIKIGPTHAHVENVRFEWGPETGKYRRFDIIPSAMG
jgi:acylphosphatase